MFQDRMLDIDITAHRAALVTHNLADMGQALESPGLNARLQGFAEGSE